MDYSDIDKSLTNGENLGGIGQTIYFGLWSDVATWPTEPSSPADLAALAALTGDIAMSAGKRMFEFYSTEDVAELQLNPIGEEGGKGIDMVLNVFHPGLRTKLLGFMNATKNEDLVLIVKDNEGQMYLMGNALRSAKFTGGDGSGTGKSREGRRGLAFAFSFVAAGVYVYSGSVPLTAASA